MTTDYVVWKFGIEVTDEFTLDMPAPAKVLHVGVQGGDPWLWALVDPGEKATPQTFYVRGTGHPVSPTLTHLGSFMLADGAFVGHLFGSAR